MHVIIIWILLTIFWIFAVYSVSIYESFRLTVRLAEFEPSNYFYFIRHIKSIVIGLIIALIAYKIPLRLIQEYRNFILIFVFILQLLVFTPLWIELFWSKWWISVPFLWTVQPAEVFKLWFIIFFAWWFVRKKKMLSTISWFIWFLILTFFLSFIFLALPDLGTLMVLAPTALLMYWYAWGRLDYVIWLLILWLFLSYNVWMQFDYIRVRFEYFFNPEIDETGRWIGWQTQQALTSIWWWWITGTWYWKWLQKFWYIPIAQSDFIFAAFSEEIWLLWNSILLTLYFLLAFYFLKQLKNVKNEYYKNLWVGIISLIIFQSFINIWVNINILPITWITLPFISYWWTALIINFVQIVILHKIINEWKYL